MGGVFANLPRTVLHLPERELTERRQHEVLQPVAEAEQARGIGRGRGCTVPACILDNGLRVELLLVGARRATGAS